MNWQLTLAGICIVAAASYIARRTWRAWLGRKAGGCGGSCSCAKPGANSDDSNRSSPDALITDDELTARLRNRA